MPDGRSALTDAKRKRRQRERKSRERARRAAGVEEIVGVPFTHEMIYELIEDGDIDREDSRDPKKLARALVERAGLSPAPEVP